MSEVPAIQFDATRARRYSPVKELEIVRIVEKPANEVTIIELKVIGPQTFVGTFVEVLNPETGALKGAYNYDDFVQTHTPWEGVKNGWYWSDPIDAYQSDIEADLIGAPKGSAQHVYIGDWIYRDRTGKVGCVSPEHFTPFYDIESARPIPQEPEER